MINKILFASDFTRVTARAETYALDIARSVNARVTVLHAIEPIADAEDDTSVAKFLDSRQNRAKTSAEAVAERFRKDGVECDVHVEVGKRWQSIIDTATEGKYDLVVLGSHKIHDGDKVYLGTTTHKVFFGADLPLLVVPSA